MFIDNHREHLGVAAICKVLPIAPSVTWQAQPCCREGTYYHHKSIELDPGKASDRAKHDVIIMAKIAYYWSRVGRDMAR